MIMGLHQRLAAWMTRTPARPRIEVDGRQIRASAFHSVRMEYVRHVLDTQGWAPRDCRAHVIGDRTGHIASGLTDLGMTVDERDDGAPHTPPHIVYLADTLELVDDVRPVLSDVRNSLAPNGVVVFDTVNRTIVSKIIYLVLFQRLPWTKIMPTGRYSAQRLRTPTELRTALFLQGLRLVEICDFAPENPIALVRAIRMCKKALVSDRDIGRYVNFALKPDTRPPVTYLGYAVGNDPPGDQRT